MFPFDPESILNLLEDIVARARAADKCIVLPESEDPRVVEAAGNLAVDRVVRPVLVGPAPVNIPEGVRHIDPASSPQLESYADIYLARTRRRGTGPEEALRAATEPLTYAALMVSHGDADGTVAGARHTTANTLRAGLRVIGAREEIRTVSTFFLMVHGDTSMGCDGAFIFSDCGLVVEPSAAELAEIAFMSAHSARQLLHCQPRVALLSYSTHGSAEHPSLTRVREARQILEAREPNLCVDGELQLDAAIVPEVAAVKAPDSPLQGRANVLVFPDLNAGNIGYKLVQRFGGARALGPITQGLQSPANDLSRGCSAQDIYEVAAITALQAAEESVA